MNSLRRRLRLGRGWSECWPSCGRNFLGFVNVCLFAHTKSRLRASNLFWNALKQMRFLVYAVAGRKNAIKKGEDQWQNERRRAQNRYMAR